MPVFILLQLGIIIFEMPSLFKKVLVAMDFSENSEAALDFALHLGEHLGSKISILHVVQTLAHYPLFFSGVITEADLRREMGREAEEKLTELAERKHQKHVAIETRVRFGDPYEEIIKEAAKLQVDLILMGTHGRTGISRALIGSVAERVVRKAKFPVLTVPLPAMPRRRLTRRNNGSSRLRRKKKS